MNIEAPGTQGLVWPPECRNHNVRIEKHDLGITAHHGDTKLRLSEFTMATRGEAKIWDDIQLFARRCHEYDEEGDER